MVEYKCSQCGRPVYTVRDIKACYSCRKKKEEKLKAKMRERWREFET